MKNKYIKLVGLSFLCSSLLPIISSCENALTEKGFDFVNPDLVGGSNEAANQWVTGAYSTLTVEMFRWDTFPHVLDFDCDYVTGPDWAFGKFGAGNYQADEHTQQMWEKLYTMIHRCNYALENIEPMSQASVAVKNNAMGELYFLKAYSYFLLVRAFGEIPLRNHSINSGSTTQNEPRQSIEKVYAEIIDLLMKAERLMYKNTDAGFVEGHASVGAAASLLAKVYVTMASGAVPQGEEVIVRGGPAYTTGAGGKIYTSPVAITHQKSLVKGYENFDSKKYFELARDKSLEVMNGIHGEYDLLPFDELWQVTNRNKTEHIWSLQPKSDDSVYGVSFGEGYVGILGDAGEVYGLNHGMRDHWYKLFEAKDYRIEKGVIHRWQRYHDVEHKIASYYPNTEEWMKKAKGYTDENGVFVPAVAPFDDGLSYNSKNDNTFLAYLTKYTYVTDRTKKRTDINYPFLRFADVLLIYAEAANEANGAPTEEALNALNRVRKRSNATEKTLTGTGNINDKVLFRSAILEERAMELAFEGDRRWDLIRWGVFLQVMNAIGGMDEADIVKARAEKHLLFPIPYSELSVNKAITQNNNGW